jgi:hypothetical protein
MFCTKCGTELPDGAAFCFKCGQATGPGPVAAAAAPPPVLEETLGTFKTAKKNSLTVTNREFRWSDGGSLHYENLDRLGVGREKREWRLDAWRTDGYNEYTTFESEQEARRALATGTQALEDFRRNPPVPPPVEYKNVQVRLDVEGKVSASAGESAEAIALRAAIHAGHVANTKIDAVLRREAERGWRPDGPMDLPTLFGTGNVHWQIGGGFLSHKYTFYSATVRLTRVNR